MHTAIHHVLLAYINFFPISLAVNEQVVLHSPPRIRLPYSICSADMHAAGGVAT